MATANPAATIKNARGSVDRRWPRRRGDPG
jgi:hypothetical protein